MTNEHEQGATAMSIMDSLVRGDRAHPDWLWRSGSLVPWAESSIHVNAVGHASVASVFEGIKAYVSHDGAGLLLFRLDEHLRRLYESARIVRIDIPYGIEILRAAVIEVLRANAYREDVYLRPWAFPAGIVQEQMVPAGVTCELVVDSWTFQSGLGTERGCRAAVSSWTRINEASMPPRVKAFSNYHNGRLAMLEARENGHDWPILLNERGKVSEGPGACIALVRDGVVSTPSTTSGILESLTRDTSITLLRELGHTVVEREVDRTELYLADEVFFMGTGWEILPVTTVDGLQVGDGTAGPLTRRLDTAYGDVVRGRSPRHKDWLTELPF
ncbi:MULTISPECIES: branched-chain amino acid transaminase [unclassified Streptomyces]|jgi:branched-chain amino acid aminotransferase, group I|uniref:branched-chain amino acid transaminase n=1 Tax=unclassified Streptomyces TaxID=2593676 RepID=UPI002E27290E